MGCNDDDGRDTLVLPALRVLGGRSMPMDAKAMRASLASSRESLISSPPPPLPSRTRGVLCTLLPLEPVCNKQCATQQRMSRELYVRVPEDFCMVSL
jgi:hypothetical protein